MRTALVVVLAPAVCLVQAQGQPRLEVDAIHHDFGPVVQGTKVSHRFKLSNTGDAPLNILRMNSSCGCTSTLLGKARLEPGESTELEVSFNSAGLRGPANKSVQVVTDDPAAPDRTLTFQADVVGDIQPSEREVRFQDLAPGDRRKTSVKLESSSGRAIAVTDVKLSEAPWLGVATREEGQAVYVDFELLARDLPADRSSGTDTVVLYLNNGAPYTARLKVSWAKRPAVAVAPARIAWAEPAGRELAATVTLEARGPRPFRILSASTSSPLLTVAGFDGKPARRHRLKVVLSAAAPAGSYEEKVLLALDTPENPALEIRVAAALR